MKRLLMSWPRRGGKATIRRAMDEQIWRAVWAGIDKDTIKQLVIIAWARKDVSEAPGFLAQLIDAEIAEREWNNR